MKVLSIIIPTYNMETLLPQCLESILHTSVLDNIEVVVVNDGSRDKSLSVAREYESRYKDVVRVVDKPNGNYGSTVNAALPLVRGTYVRILDADDCFNGSLLSDYMAVLQKNIGVDMVVAPFIEVRRHSERRVEYDIYSRHPYDCNRIYDAERIFADNHIRFFAMHSVCYRTALLRDIDYHQSEGISYTDQEWVFYPLFGVSTMLFTDIPLYRYNLSREGQTMATDVQMRNISHLVKVTTNMADYFAKADKSLLSESRTTFLRNIVKNRIRVVLRKYLLEMPDSLFADSGFEDVNNSMRQLAADCHIESMDVPVNNLLRVDMLAAWVHSGGRRYPAFVRHMLRCANSIMEMVHGILFR